MRMNPVDLTRRAGAFVRKRAQIEQFADFERERIERETPRERCSSFQPQLNR
jgi:hypothetical protein